MASILLCYFMSVARLQSFKRTCTLSKIDSDRPFFCLPIRYSHDFLSLDRSSRQAMRF